MDADAPLVLRAFKDDLAVHEGEECVVSAHADVGAGVELGAALANQNAARSHDLAGKALHAEPLGIAVAAVLG